ncbi:MAG: HAMP domain-containing sensor histidine kinase [Thermodesulfovibrionales bacterium]|jgi:signal transduction histidine kinase
MFRTLYYKLAAVLLGLFCLIGALNILLTLSTTRLYFQEVNQKLNRTLAQNLASETSLMKDGRVNEKALQDIFHMMMVVNPNIEVYLLDPNGNILAFSAPPGKVKRQKVALEPVKSFLNKTDAFPILGDDPRNLKRKKVFSAAPISPKSQIQGYLYVVLGGEEFDTVAEMLQGSYILRSSIGIVAGALLFALLAGLLLFFRMTLRLRRLTADMETFRQSDFSEYSHSFHSLKGRSRDEIDRLGSIFTQMADRIIRLIKELRQADTLRRELVTFIAHDLRTPLASLKGYLETLLLKEGRVEPEKQRSFLEIAIKNCNQLSKLISNLFEMTRLDSPDVQVHMESFSLGELMQDIVQKFQFVAETKKIRLQTNFVKDLPFVFADIGLIERVLENLIENASRYTPKSGAITISVVPKEERLIIQVSDTGSGMQPEDQLHLFERSYRLKRERRKDAEGTGLGLIITKRILELHGSDIKVDSVVDVGTTFTFTLPIYKA